MKKYAVLILLAVLLAAPAHASYYECEPVVAAGGEASPAFWPFATAVGFAAFVVYANAEGIDFPLCGQDWLNHPEALGLLGEKCWGQYPSGVNRG